MGTKSTPRRPLVRIRDSLIDGMIGKLVHIDGFNPAAAFRIMSTTPDRVYVETPKTKKPFNFPRWRVQYTREDEPDESVEPRTNLTVDEMVEMARAKCSSKARYKDPQKAAMAAKAVWKRTGSPSHYTPTIGIYHCPYCKQYHLGNHP